MPAVPSSNQNQSWFESGQSLLEITITLAVAVTLIVALTITTLQGLQSSQYSQNQILATKYAQEGLERVNLLKSTDTPITIAGTPRAWYTDPTIWSYNLGVSSSCAGCKFQFNSTCTNGVCATICTNGICNLAPLSGQGEKVGNGLFLREIWIEDSGVDQKKLTSRVSWTDSSGQHESRLVTYLTNY